MLQLIRDRLTGMLAFFIFAILIIPFAFVGVDSYFTSVPDNAVARVNDKDITIADFQTSWTRYQGQIRSALGENYDLEQFDTPVARRDHLEGLINRELMLQFAEQSRLAVSADELRSRVHSIPAFQLDGQFNPDLYQRMLAAQGMSPGQFERDMSKDMIISQIPAAIMASSIASDTEVQTMIALQNQTRSFESLRVLAAPFLEGVEISDEQVSEWFAANPNEFMSEETVLIEYVELNVADFDAQITVEDEVLEKQFEEQKGRFLTAEERLASHILISLDANADAATTETARQLAEEIADKARAGEDFAELAKQNSADIGSAQSGGDLGWIEPGVMVKAFEDALYALGKGDVSEPIKTGFGFHVIQLRDINPSTGMNFAEAKEQLRNEYLSASGEKVYLEQADRLVDLIYEDPTTLETVASELDLEIKTEGPFARGSGFGVALNPAINKAAFSELVLVEGSSSEPIEIATNHIVVLRVREHNPSVPKALELVSEQIKQQLQQTEATELAEAKANELLALATGSGDLQATAEMAELEYKLVEAAGRKDIQYGIKLLEQVFKLPASDREMHVVAVQNDYALVRQIAVIPGSSASPEESFQLKKAIANSAGVVANSEVLAWLREQAKIDINEDKLEGNLY